MKIIQKYTINNIGNVNLLIIMEVHIVAFEVLNSVTERKDEIKVFNQQVVIGVWVGKEAKLSRNTS